MQSDVLPNANTLEMRLDEFLISLRIQHAFPERPLLGRPIA